MVKIRLRRVGAKKQPHYRVVVQDSRSPRDGKFIEIIGNYNPRTEPPTMELDAERAVHWLSVGAQPSEAVRRMFDKLGILAQATLAKQAEPAAPAALLPLKPVEIEEELPVEEDEEFEVDLLEETEEPEETEDEWESDAEVSDEADDFEEDDWDSDVEDTDDDDDEDEPLDDDQ